MEIVIILLLTAIISSFGIIIWFIIMDHNERRTFKIGDRVRLKTDLHSFGIVKHLQNLNGKNIAIIVEWYTDRGMQKSIYQKKDIKKLKKI